jgi:type VI secretion system secreted protein VgrG
MSKVSKETSQILDNRVVAKVKSNFLILCAVAAFVALLCPALASATTILGSAQSFAVLGHETVTNAHVGSNPTTQVYGNLGVTPGTSVTGFYPDGTVTGGTIYSTGSDAPAVSALADANTAYTTLAGLSGTDYSGTDLGGLTLTPGVYFFSTTAFLTGILPLTLDFQGNPNADFVFLVGTALTTGSGSSVNVINGNSTSGVYWLMGVTGGSGTGSATLGPDTVFAGNILALTSISLDERAKILCGRAFALNGAVTLIDNLISNNNTAEDFGSGRSDFGSYGFSGSPVPLPPTLVLLGSGLVGLGAFRFRLGKGATKA